MYRDDNEAMYHRLEAVDRQVGDLEEQNETIRQQNEALRQQMDYQMRSHPLANDVYKTDVMRLPPENRGALAYHRVTRFPVWAAGLLNFITFGLFGLIHFGLIHDKLPKAAANDPTAGKAIGFSFIPYYNMYWVFFNSMRLCDRLDLQYRLRGMPARAPKGMMIACSIFTVIPYLNVLIGWPFMWTIGCCMLQATVNDVARLDPHKWAE